MSYKICKKCVMDDTAPLILDKDGVCNYCHEFQKVDKERRVHKQELPWYIYEMKKSKGYHCLLGLSGGVDSSMCLHLIVEQGLKPLCFSVDTGYNDPKADENIMRMVEKLKVPFIRKVVDLEEFKKLQSAFEQSKTLNIEIPTDHVLMAMTYKTAKENGIKWIISGGNHATEGIMPPEWGYNAKDLTFLKAVYKKFTGLKIKNLPTISLLQYIWYRFINKIKIINLLDFYEYKRDEAIELLNKEYGYQSYGDKHHESTYTKWFQNEYLPRFGVIKDKAHYSSMICSGQMKREDALKLLEGRIIGTEKHKSHLAYKNSEHHWNLLSKIYKCFK